MSRRSAPPISNAIVTHLATRAAKRILADYKAGEIPMVSSFTELQDYVDANTYLLTNAGNYDASLQRFSDKHSADDKWTGETLYANLSAAIDRINAWLVSGGLQGQ